MKKFVNPELSILAFRLEDVICTSGEIEDPTLPGLPEGNESSTPGQTGEDIDTPANPRKIPGVY